MLASACLNPTSPSRKHSGSGSQGALPVHGWKHGEESWWREIAILYERVSGGVYRWAYDGWINVLQMVTGYGRMDGCMDGWTMADMMFDCYLAALLVLLFFGTLDLLSCLISFSPATLMVGHASTFYLGRGVVRARQVCRFGYKCCKGRCTSL